MRAHLAACFIVTVWAIFTLLHLALADPKPIQITVSPRFGFPGSDIYFRVRLQPIDSDRELWAVLCDVDDPPCSFEHHVRMSGHEIEGENTPKLWSPPPFKKVEGGIWIVAAAIGPKGAVRASASERVELTVGAQP